MAASTSPLQELSTAIAAAEYFNIYAEFDLPSKTTLEIYISKWDPRHGGPVGLRMNEVKGSKTNYPPNQYAQNVGDALQKLAVAYPAAVLRPDRLVLQVNKGPITSIKLRPIFLQALEEAYGRPIPTLDDLSKQKKAATAAKKSAANDVVEWLRSGFVGVAKFNKLSDAERFRVDLRKADLADCDLTGLKIEGTRFDGADLSRATLTSVKATASSSFAKAKFVEADLTGTDLVCCRFGDADFSSAKMAGVNLIMTTLTRACFVGADLTNAQLGHADIRGADFSKATLTGAKFEQARFDEKTKWPKGFKIPQDLQWKGVGPDPRLMPSKKEKALPKPADFSGFLDRLKLATDAAKLDKAMSMLKAEKFNLFAKVAADHVVGVVKSQSSAELVYSCRLASDGTYACCTQNLNVCGGLRGSPCKHLLVLIVGLAKAGELDAGTAHEWTQASRGLKAELDKDVMTETLLQYKGAEAGEVDWRPTETIPEDFYAM